MPNYNSQLQSNNTDLQTVLQALQTKAGGGEQATPVISVNTAGLITATAGVKTSTYQLAFQPAKTIIPSTTSQIAVSSGYYTGGNITVAGDSNLVASNIKSGVRIFGVNGTLSEGSSGGEAAEWSENEDAIISKTISSYTNDRVTSIGNFAFADCDNLTSVNFPACTSIGSNAFTECYNLTSVNFPNCTNINYAAFEYCRSLTLINFPACEHIENYAFQHCYNLTSVNFPACEHIDAHAFGSCSKLITVSFPACEHIENYAFQKCYNLSQLYLTGSSLCNLSNSNAFKTTPYAGYSASFSGTPYIYVPASLLASYQTATNWTYFSSYFSAFEGETTEPSEEIITFMINNTEYQALNGMTWREWINSSYNNTELSINDLSQVTIGIYRVKDINGNIELADNIIQPSALYTCIIGGGGAN